MQLRDIKAGAKVQFITLRRGKRVGLDDEIYTIVDVNFNDWEACNLLLECEGHEVYTSHEAVELASEEAIKRWEALHHNDQFYEQLTIFDLLEV